jgi:hypothetical protein
MARQLLSITLALLLSLAADVPPLSVAVAFRVQG